MRIKQMYSWLLHPPDDASASAILRRLMAGGVFLWEGILKPGTSPLPRGTAGGKNICAPDKIRSFLTARSPKKKHLAGAIKRSCRNRRACGFEAAKVDSARKPTGIPYD